MVLSVLGITIQLGCLCAVECLRHNHSTWMFIPLNVFNLTRSSKSNNFYIKQSKLEIQRKSFSHVGVKWWNEVPSCIRELPKRAFKKRIRSILLDILQNENTYPLNVFNLDSYAVECLRHNRSTRKTVDCLRYSHSTWMFMPLNVFNLNTYCR